MARLAGVTRFVPDTGYSMSTTGTRPKPAGSSPRPEGVRPTTHPLRNPGSLSPAMRTRRGITLLLMTLFVPGSAQVTAGNRRWGRVGLRIWFGVLILGAALLVTYFFDRAFVIGLFARPTFLLLLIGALIVLALLWAALFVDAWRLGAPRLQTAGARRGIAVTDRVAGGRHRGPDALRGQAGHGRPGAGVQGVRRQPARRRGGRALQRAVARRGRRQGPARAAAGQHDAGQHRREQRPDRDVLVPAQHAERPLPGQLADAPASSRTATTAATAACSTRSTRTPRRTRASTRSRSRTRARRPRWTPSRPSPG